jgi:hypothetical protein
MTNTHAWTQIGTIDAEGMRTHAIPGDICVECSDATGFLVPVSQCPPALVAWEADHAALDAWEAEGGS